MTAKVRLSVKAIKVWDSWKNFVSEMRLKSSVVIGSDDVIGESIHANSIFESSSAAYSLMEESSAR